MRISDVQKPAIQMPVEQQGSLDGHESIVSRNGTGPNNILPSGTGEVDSAGKRNAIKRGPKRKGKYVGVSYDKHARKWRAYITIKGSLRHLGCFDDPKIAAKVYDSWSRRLHGKRATLNFP